jgi:hypothetical protein
MHTEQETIQTVILNVLLKHQEVTYEDFKNSLIHASLIKPTTNSMVNTIRAHLISLNRYFKEHDISLYMGGGAVHRRTYSATEEAYNFCSQHLLEKMYDEEGKMIGEFFQHPIALKQERMELI